MGREKVLCICERKWQVSERYCVYMGGYEVWNKGYNGNDERDIH